MRQKYGNKCKKSCIYRKTISSGKDVFEIVDEIGEVIVLKDNKPACILLKNDENAEKNINNSSQKSNITLQEAMKIVLSEVENKTQHAS